MPFNGLYVLDVEERDDVDVYNVTKKSKPNDVNNTFMWHCRLGYINEKRTSKLHKDGLLDSYDYESYDICESCLLEKNDQTTLH